ncbi:restriction endonuclease subunit S [Desulfovibrio litoralis]|uniref:Type I restriction enzyme, S subunit n=1 Tax=Desulfovibrio litoralis DSM 11393 TaxID=1121455 RepID=A0A1M7T6X7_9BACT|nr:restriction endonuclease subunit S [Desulfovibrio litoralis]SHN66456.1 type I restriction enzyme, S subunit [Desulfovibrio litoralis DSM 11393]
MRALYPIEWIKVTCEDIVVDPKSDIVDGPFGSNLKASEYANVGVPIARIQNVKRFNFVDKNISFVTPKKAYELKRHSFFSGDILITKLGSPLGLACEVPQHFKSGIIVADIVRLRHNKKICLTSYLVYLINSEVVIKQIEKHVKGTTRPRINLGVIRGLDLPLPPLAEQKVIADKLDTLLSLVKDIQIRLARISFIIKRFRQSVLAAAMSGKLTEEWRKNHSYHSASNDFTKIKEQRDSIVVGKSKMPQSHLFYEEYQVPPSWIWVSLDSLTYQIVDGTHHTPKYTESGIPFISVKDIKKGKIDFSDTKFIDKREHIELSKRCPVKKGDLLFTKSGTIGRTAIVNTDKEFSLFVSVALLKPASSSVNMRFIDMALQKWTNEIDVSSRIVGSAIKNLHLRDMRVLAIPFAPLEEQAEIVRCVEELFAFIDNIEQKNNAVLGRVNNLTQSILAKAFRGELTADWRAANPDLISGANSAKALLEKIKFEREELKKQPKLKRITAKKQVGESMSKQIIEVAVALKKAGKPLSGQQLLAASGYPSDSNTEELERFFLDIRKALMYDRSIVKLERNVDDKQDWFSLAKTSTQS